jgi:murein DD-endopeptidase MepM/ murein hydrolase activator NlpD
MKQSLLLLFGLLLTSCTSLPDTPIPVPSRTYTPIPSFTTNPASLPFLLPSLPAPNNTAIPLITPFETAIYTQTNPAETPISWIYVFPVQPSNVADFLEGTSSHGYPATDIFAPEGSKYVAVTAGVVDFVSYEDQWNPEHDDPALRGGLSVAIIGEDGVRYYGSHLSALERGISPGVLVKAGQILGYVGHTGNARTTTPHLHFGISRPTYPEDWHARRGEVDPFPFLVAWRDGHNVTPPLPTP